MLRIRCTRETLRRFKIIVALGGFKDYEEALKELIAVYEKEFERRKRRFIVAR